MRRIAEITADITTLIEQHHDSISDKLRRIHEIDAELSRPMGATVGNKHYEDWRDVPVFDGGENEIRGSERAITDDGQRVFCSY